MARGTSGAGSPGERRGGSDRATKKAVLIALAVAVVAICLGGTAAIVAASRGASTWVSLAVMAPVVLCGAVGAFAVLQRPLRHRHEGTELVRVRSRGIRRAARAHQRALREPGALLERQLSARYGVQVKRVAWHVWRINGELVEATLDPTTGQLISGGRELQL
jgi:hypothetical protein